MERPVVGGKEAAKEIDRRIEEVNATRKHLQKELNKAEVLAKELMEMSEAVKHAKQVLPEL
jgi:seryl-tRNA synthetase